ncbi:hypothetical protein DXB59_07630 [Ruminococcus sp. OM05-10BH]|nr:hypothetical protein DXB59_07630 [Ruminococcus sp. OM05-10BH]
MILSAKRTYYEKEEKLHTQLLRASQREKEAYEIEHNYNNIIAEETRRITAQAYASVEKKYKAKNRFIYLVTIGSLLYCFLATTLTACNSPRFVKDISAFASVLCLLISQPVDIALEVCEAIFFLKDTIPIPYQILNMIIAVVLVIIIFVLITGLLYGFAGFLIYKAAKFYHDEFWDLPSGVIALISMSILVWFSDRLVWISWNFILVWFLIHGVYLLIRMMISSSKNSDY